MTESDNQEKQHSSNWQFPFGFSKRPTGWALGVTDGFIVLMFSTAPLLITSLLLVIYSPKGPNALSLGGVVGEYFGKGELLFVALSILGSVAAKIWLDPQYRPHWVLPMQLSIVAVFVLCTIIATGRTLALSPKVNAVLILSVVSLVIAMLAYVWLIAKGGDLEPISVEQSLNKSSKRSLADELRKLREGGT